MRRDESPAHRSIAIFSAANSNAQSSFVRDFRISNLKARKALDVIAKLPAWLTF
jgi:hypothetical protein